MFTMLNDNNNSQPTTPTEKQSKKQPQQLTLSKMKIRGRNIMKINDDIQSQKRRRSISALTLKKKRPSISSSMIDLKSSSTKKRQTAENLIFKISRSIKLKSAKINRL